MRTSHRNIHKMINDVKVKITDEELFTSNAFKGYLEDIAEVVSKRYKRPIKLNVFYDENNSFQACTDNRVITINAGNKEISILGNRVKKVNAIIGLLGHELGHINFTDFALMELFKTKLSKGIFYPTKPIPENTEEKLAFDEIKELLKSKDEVATGIITSVLCYLENILEDAYIEARMCSEFPGKLKKCIIMQRVISIDNEPSILEQINAKYNDLSIMLNLILSYATAFRINNDGNYSGEYLDKLKDCIIHIDNSVCCDDIKERLKSSLQILLKLWKYIKEIIEKEREKQQNNQGQQNQSNTSSGRKSSKLKKEAMESCNASLASQMPTMSAIPKGKEDSVEVAVSEDAPVSENGQALKDAKNEIQQVVAEELGRINSKEITPLSNPNGSGNIVKDNNFAGSGYGSIASDTERVLNSIANEIVNQAEEEKLANNMQSEADEIDYRDIHRYADITIHRINPVPDYLKEQYKRVSPPLVLLSKKLQKGIKNIIKERKYGGKQNGLYMGRRIETRSLLRDDGKYFYKRKLPDEELDIAIAVLVDESGSMRSRDRITVARAASVVLYDFCKNLNIPVSILGHTANDGYVDLYSYADFDSVDGNDRYRIMDMCARDCNRDGMALRYVAEKLMKRTEKVKLLITISDGQPYDLGYIGPNAEEDLRQIKKEYTQKGITMFAAAIGDDKETIQRIYKEGFLDITELNKMPVNLIKLITKYVK